MRYLTRRANDNSLFRPFFSNDLLELLWPNRESSIERQWAPSVDIMDRKDRYLIKADLPGVEKKDIKVELNDGILTISGERKNEVKEEEENYYRCERSYGQFHRSFRVEGVKEEAIKAEYKDGILTLELPKESENKQVKSIEIQ